jgi:hypothetical protein
MSPNPIIDDTRRQLSELEAQIRAARTAPDATQRMAGKVHKDWEDMLRAHDAIRERLDAATNATPQIVEGLRLDVDALRHSFARWMARVESGYAEDLGRKGKSAGGVI